MSKNEGKRKAPAKQVEAGGSKSKRSSKQPQLFRPEVPYDLNVPLFATPKEAEYYASYNDDNIYSTKFYHRPSMEKLGIHDGVASLFRHIGWEGFLNLEAKTYAVPTKEFLATCYMNDATRTLSFRLRSQAHELSYDRLNEIMHTPTEGYTQLNSEPLKTFDGSQFWSQITVLREHNGSRDRDTSIIHPCWRIANRMTTACLLAKAKSTSQVNNTNLAFLWAMAQPQPIRPDFATFFLEKVYTTARSQGAEICFGGFVTLIGQSLGYNFEDDEPIDDLYSLDIAALQRATLIKKCSREHAGSYHWLYREKKPLYIIPNPKFSNFDRANPLTWKPPLDFVLPPEFKHESLIEPVVEVPEEPPQTENEEEENEAHEYPLNVHQQLASLTLQARNFDRDIRQLQANQNIIMHQTNDIWCHFRPPGGYPIYPPYQPPPGGASD